jgi:hypothetical protein
MALAARDPEASWLAATASLHEAGDSPYGYCTEFLLKGEKLDSHAVLEKMLTLGDSVLVVGDESLLRVHVHTHDPGAALSYGTSLGSVTTVQVGDIRTQAEEFVTRPRARGEALAARVSTVAVVSGLGLEQVLHSLGVTAVVRGGQTMNPSTEEILTTVEACSSSEVIILPNNKNVVMAARQAAEHSTKKVEGGAHHVRATGSGRPPGLTPRRASTRPRRHGRARQSGAQSRDHRAAAHDSRRAARHAAGSAIALTDGELKVAEERCEARCAPLCARWSRLRAASSPSTTGPKPVERRPRLWPTTSPANTRAGDRAGGRRPAHYSYIVPLSRDASTIRRSGLQTPTVRVSEDPAYTVDDTLSSQSPSALLIVPA